jgi:diguanylate cyclase (GGDEF)-like protein
VLAAVTIVLAVWVSGEIAGRHERDEVDARLAGSLRAARSEMGAVLMDARVRAEDLARSRRVQSALSERDQQAAAAIVLEEPGVGLYADGRLLAGTAERSPARRTAVVVGRGGRTLGSVVANVPLDTALARRLAREAGLTDPDVAAIAAGRRLVTASADVGGTIPAGRSGSVDLNGGDYRYLSGPLLADTSFRLVALGSTDPVDEAAGDARRRALLAALASVALIALLAWTATRLFGARAPVLEPAAGAGRRARDTRRDEGRRAREAMKLVGDALAATHDPAALLPVILESAVEATGAAGARVVSGDDEVARVGDPGSGGRPLDLRLGTEEEEVGRLLLYPPAGARFDGEAVQLANWLAAQASIALENERLHRTVKRQAITDELTQLANRRRFTETLAHEVRRAERFGDPLTLVLADIDDFKQVNDRYGHQVGDEVLRRFADVLRDNVRDFDLPVRFGGEEFAVLLPGTGLEGGEQLARRLASALADLRLPQTGADRAPVTASFGVASFPAARGAEALLSAADQALYQAKFEGKDRVVSASESGRRA